MRWASPAGHSELAQAPKIGRHDPCYNGVATDVQELPMAENSRAHNLASAADQYGKEALRHLNLIRAFGQEIVSGFSAFLGVHHLDVRGVPSQGGWDPDVADYRDAKFSFFERGIISIEPIDMGLAVRVRHIQDDGYFWA